MDGKLDENQSIASSDALFKSTFLDWLSEKLP
jgi:hypothetical protein